MSERSTPPTPAEILTEVATFLRRVEWTDSNSETTAHDYAIELDTQAGAAALRRQAEEQKNDHRAALLPGDPSAHASTEPLPITFERFSAVNRERCESPYGFNHTLASWSTSDWFTAIMGEFGEAANIAKKLNRVRDGIPGNKESEAQLRDKLRRELGDVFVYLDLLAQALGFNIGAAAVDVFNAKSDEIGCATKMVGSAPVSLSEASTDTGEGLLATIAALRAEPQAGHEGYGQHLGEVAAEKNNQTPWWVCFHCWVAYYVPTSGYYGKCQQCGRDTRRWPANPLDTLLLREWCRESATPALRAETPQPSPRTQAVREQTAERIERLRDCERLPGKITEAERPQPSPSVEWAKANLRAAHLVREGLTPEYFAAEDALIAAVHASAPPQTTDDQARSGQSDRSTADPRSDLWRPIESAPKDGTPFLVYWNKSMMGSPTIDILNGWREYQEIIGYGEPEAIAWCALPAPPAPSPLTGDSQ